MARLNLTSSGTPYIVIINTSGQYWNGTAFEAYAAANWATYDVAATQYGSSDVWYVTFPTAVPNGSIDVIQFRQAGESPVESDTVEAVGTFDWDGQVLDPSPIVPPTNPTDCACAWKCLDDNDDPVAGVVIRARPDVDADGTGYAWSGKTRSATSVAGTGLATINLPQASKWWIRRDSGEEELFTVPSESTSTAVVSVRGGKRDTY